MENSQKPKFQKRKSFDPRRYPIVLRVVDGYLEISQPDLNITQVRGKFDDITQAEEIGRAVLDVMSRATKKYVELFSTEESTIPQPSHPKGILVHPGEAVLGINEVAQMIGVSKDTVRRLCLDGKLNPVLTRGKHRRFRLKNVLSYLEAQGKTPSS